MGHGKKYRNARSQVEDRAYDLGEAVKFLKDHRVAKFDETVELAVRLGVDTKKSDQTVRGTSSLPHGTGRAVRVVAFASGDAAEATKTAGADHVGFEDLIKKIQEGWVDFDVAVATPDAMQEVRKLGRVLGPRGLMPNPKTGTVSEDIGSAVTKCKAGRVEFRMDKHGNVQMPVGKLSFGDEQLVENIETALNDIRREKPQGISGVFIKRCTVSSTMGVGLAVNVRG